ncbi:MULTISPECIES: preprotein translocase subunit YajC [Rufibacter]|uniref:Sec translocon accessory complex subunit YajC n=1 Tax=Rufibacter quisquiliarum TaxID=1549639 RepID=A0A839GNR7_9BACT|nr:MULTISPECIES: preprotein translocase subunit YajC [Rufibacter]MBA9078449.1 preprotein translocase subunit YajC [Rufibacter quisquiliarum]
MLTILLQAAAPGGGMSQFLLIGAIFIVFYFFIMRPQQKKAKDQRKFRDELKRGMQVVTIGGLHGRILSIDEDAVWLEIDKGIKLKFDKVAIARESASKVAATTETVNS